jgi:geranylgeranyl pyrophosphate synthase
VTPDSPRQETGNQAARRLLEDELDTVQDRLFGAVTDLGSPLSDLVQARIRAADPPLRAALVLSAGYNGAQGNPLHRVQLAAALEMLHVALGIHQLLVDSASTASLSQDDDDRRSFIGSTILAGDFCFSRSAQMAAKTENPTIVTIFAEALQDVSESRLRDLFSDQNARQNAHPHMSDEILLRSGAKAAVELSDLPAAGRAAVLELTTSTIDSLLTAHTPPDVWNVPGGALPAAHRLRWQALHDWLADLSDAR